MDTASQTPSSPAPTTCRSSSRRSSLSGRCSCDWRRSRRSVVLPGAFLMVLLQVVLVDTVKRSFPTSTTSEPPSEPPSVALLSAPPPLPPSDSAALGDFLHISVTSSAHLLLVSINNTVVTNMNTTIADVRTSSVEFTPWELTSGIYIHVFHPQDGRLMMKRILNTALFGSSHEVPSVLKSLTWGHLVVIAIKNDAAQNITPMTRKLLSRIGLRSALTLGKREAMAWVATLGGPVWAEARTLDVYEELGMMAWACPVTLDVMVPKLMKDTSCFLPQDQQESARTAFCSQYDGYGSLCSCPDPAPLRYHTPELEGSTILDVPLLVLAGNRPSYLYRSLLTLMRQPGGVRERLFVLIDGRHPEVSQLLDLLQVSYEEHSSQGVNLGAKISDQYRYGLSLVLTKFPNASKVILLEEDLLASPDFFSYFNQTSWLLEADPSLVCISAWSDLGSLHVAKDPHLLRRVEVLPGLGWMVTRNTAEGLLQIWPSNEWEHDWDIWVRQPGIMAGRECVVPDVTRTFHIGLMGSHAPGLLHAAFFAFKPVPATSHVRLLDVDRMTVAEYEAEIFKVLEGDEVLYLQSSLHPCHPSYLPLDIKDRPVIIFIEMVGPGDNYAWQFLARCLGIWDLDTRGHHHGLFRFYLYDTELLVIGYPFSDYSYLKPSSVNVLTVNASKELSTLDLMPLTHRARFRRPKLERLAPYPDIAEPVF